MLISKKSKKGGAGKSLKLAQKIFNDRGRKPVMAVSAMSLLTQWRKRE
jgi:hypothetical protein